MEKNSADDGMPKNRRRKRQIQARSKKELNALRRSISSIRDYYNGNRSDVVLKWKKKLGIGFVPKTIDNFLNDESLEDSARRTTVPDLIRLGEHLPPFNDVKHEIFGFIVAELGGNVEEIKALKNYSDRYLFHHHFQQLGMFDSGADHMNISVKRNGHMAAFSFNYVVDDKPTMCSGYFFKKGHCLYMLDISKTSVFFGKFSSVVEPNEEIIRGFAFFEQTNRKRVQLSPVVLQHKDLKLGPTQEDNLNAHLGKTVDELFNKNR